MPTNYPNGLDNFTNPTPANQLSDGPVLHSDEHSNANDAISALEQWVGISGSTNPATIEFRVNHPPAGVAGLGVVVWASGTFVATGTVLNFTGDAVSISASGSVVQIRITGSIGPQGPIGPSGSPGNQGLIGPAGPSGSPGSNGLNFVGLMGWNNGVPLGTGTVLNARGAALTLSGTVLDLFVTGSMPSGPAGGDLTGTYPNPQVMWGNGTGFYGTVFAPLTHAYQHESGGVDPIPIDLLAMPVYPSNWLDANTGTHGLMRPLSGDPTNFIGGDGLEHSMPSSRIALYLEDVAVYVTGTHSLIRNYPSGVQTSVSQLIVSTTTGTVFAQPFMSAAGLFGFVPSQEVRIVVTAAITAGTKVTFLYSQLLKYSSSGTSTLIGSSNLHQITASPLEFDLGMNIPDTIFDPTERLQLKVFGIAPGAGGNPTATLYYDGTTSSRVEIGADFVGGGLNIFNNFLGVFGINQGVNLGTGTTLSVTGSRLSMSLVGTTLNLTSSPDPVELIGVMGWQNGVPIGTGTMVNFRGSPPITVSLSGTVLDVFVTGQALPAPVFGVMGQDEGVPLGTGTTLNFRGVPITATISGTVIDVFVTGTPGATGPAGTPLLGIMGRNNGTNLGTGSTIDFGIGFNAAITGTTLFVHGMDSGTNGDHWVRITGSAQGAGWVTQDYNIQWFIGDGTNAISTGSTTAGIPYVDVPVDSIVDSWAVVADATGSIVVDILKSTYGGFPPASPLAGLGQPLLSSKRTNVGVASGTATVLHTDQLLASVSSVSTVKNVTVSLRAHKIATS